MVLDLLPEAVRLVEEPLVLLQDFGRKRVHLDLELVCAHGRHLLREAFQKCLDAQVDEVRRHDLRREGGKVDEGLLCLLREQIAKPLR